VKSAFNISSKPLKRIKRYVITALPRKRRRGNKKSRKVRLKRVKKNE
jgi:hypothetical protein